MKQKLNLLTCIFFAGLLALVIVTFPVMVSQSRRLFFAYFVLLIIFAFICISMIQYIKKNVVDPTKELTEAIKKVNAGNLDDILDLDQSDELGDACREFENLRIKIKTNKETRAQSEKENRELISNISHDLKTPITAIKGYVEGIMDGIADSPEKIDRYVRTVYNKANDMDRLIDELTFYSKVDTNRIKYNFDKVNIAAFFEDCAEEVGMDLEAQGIEFEYDCEVSSDTIVIADVEQLKKVINNIISNSLKYMDKDEKRIQLRVLDDGDFVKTEIEDNGKGIAARDIPLIFDRFYRTDSSRNSGLGGSGIGLSIVKKIIEDHGGRIWASSCEGNGTTIVIILRKYQEADYD